MIVYKNGENGLIKLANFRGKAVVIKILLIIAVILPVKSNGIYFDRF